MKKTKKYILMAKVNIDAENECNILLLAGKEIILCHSPYPKKGKGNNSQRATIILDLFRCH